MISADAQPGHGPWRGPLFIVGYSRSGTTLLRTMLNAHSRIHISDETHYFDDLRPGVGNGREPLDAGEKDRVRHYFGAIKDHRYAFAFSGERQERRPQARSPAADDGLATADEFFQAHCVQAADAAGKRIWGEKTPRHLFRVREMMAAFPEAKFIVLIRDPQGVVASYRDWKNQWLSDGGKSEIAGSSIALENTRARRSYNLTIITLMWLSAAKEALKLRARLAPNILRVLRFEDLLRAPEKNISSIVEWIGETYEPQMLDVAVVGSSYPAGAGRGVDATIAGRWKSLLSGDEKAYVDWLTGPTARSLGYAKDPTHPRLGVIAREAMALPFAVTRAWRANHRRIGNPVDFARRRLAAMFLTGPR